MEEEGGSGLSLPGPASGDLDQGNKTFQIKRFVGLPLPPADARRMWYLFNIPLVRFPPIARNNMISVVSMFLHVMHIKVE